MSRIRELLEEIKNPKVLKEASMNEGQFLSFLAEYRKAYKESEKSLERLSKILKKINEESDALITLQDESSTGYGVEIWKMAVKIYDSKKTEAEQDKFVDAYDKAWGDSRDPGFEDHYTDGFNK